jgi:hypothetical protein
VRLVVNQDRADAAALGEQRIAAEAEQVEVNVSLASFLLSPLTSMVMVFVVSPGLGEKVSVLVLAMQSLSLVVAVPGRGLLGGKPSPVGLPTTDQSHCVADHDVPKPFTGI